MTPIHLASYAGVAIPVEPIWHEGGLAVHPQPLPDGELDDDSFNITHVRSGYSVRHALERDEAISLAALLLEVGDWDRETTELYADRAFVDRARQLLTLRGYQVPPGVDRLRERLAQLPPLRPTDPAETVAAVTDLLARKHK